MDVSRLGGGYADTSADPGPTATAVLEAARPGAATSRLVILAGPPGVGKSTLGARLLELLPGSMQLDKDWAAAGFVLNAARQAGVDESRAYGTPLYWSQLRPQEYAGAVRAACANLVGRRTVVLIGGWGPELAVGTMWPELARRIAPCRLAVLHLDPPPLDVWQARLAGRGTRFDNRAAFARFATAVCRFDVWEGAAHLDSTLPAEALAQTALSHLADL